MCHAKVRLMKLINIDINLVVGDSKIWHNHSIT